MIPPTNTWVIVLAAGEGLRLRALTKSVPKQYCSFGRERPMIQWALDRAKSLAPIGRILAVVAREHEGWWRKELADLPLENVIVQPRNRGTAAGILLPLVEILKRDSGATVVLLPSDHYVADEQALSCSVERAIAAVLENPGEVALLGITPEDIETEYGWILPSGACRGELHSVKHFVEKPNATVAAELLRQGAVWNSFVLAAAGRTLLYAYARALPEMLEPFLRELVVVPSKGGVDALYETLPTKDFSRHVLERVPDSLGLIVVPPCGWTDLGTPVRLRRFVEATRTHSLSA